MKLIFAVLDVSLTMGLTRCYKTEGFFTFIPRISEFGISIYLQFSQIKTYQLM